MYVWSKWRCYVDGCVMSSFCSTTLTYLRRSFNQVMCVALWSDFLGVVAFDFMWYSVRDSVSCFKSWNALPPVYNKLRKLEQPTHHPLHPVLSNTFRGKMEGWYFFLGANELTTCCRRLKREETWLGVWQDRASCTIFERLEVAVLEVPELLALQVREQKPSLMQLGAGHFFSEPLLREQTEHQKSWNTDLVWFDGTGMSTTVRKNIATVRKCAEHTMLPHVLLITYCCEMEGW